MTSVHQWCSELGSGHCTSAAEPSTAVSVARSVVRRRDPGPGDVTAGSGIVGCDPGLFDSVGENKVEADAIEAGQVVMVMASFLSRTMIGKLLFREVRVDPEEQC